MPQHLTQALDEMNPAVREEAIAFIREWLPERAKAMYRALIADDPEGWRAHPHFAGGFIVDHVLRGNGLTEEVLGVADLEGVWPGLLTLALAMDAMSGTDAGAPEQTATD